VTGLLDRDFGKYRLLKRLGRGGMADVYLAHDTEHDRDVALKLVEIRGDRDSREICDAERRGALLQDQFSRMDNHVPLVHGWGTNDGWFFIDMEYVDGEDLAERAGRGPMPAGEASWVGVEICSFLERAHRFEAALEEARVRGIIHGDIKPRNVRLNRAGELKVLDFGIAKGLSLSRKLTRNDFGSVSYMSPERLDTGDVDVHSDLWSVGVLLYELVAGRVPFEAETTPRLEAVIRSRQPAPPLPAECPPALTRIILKAIAGDLRRRYQDAGEIREDLEAFRAGLETRADREWLGVEAVDERTRRTAPPHESEAGETRRTATEPETDPAPEEEATRRTGSAPVEAEATRRTGAAEVPPLPAGLGAAPNSASVPLEPAPGPKAPPLTRRARLGAGLVLLAAIGVVMNEASVWSDARRLRVDVATAQPGGAHDLWDRYQALSSRSLLRVGVAGLRGPLRDRLIAQADRVIADYRQDAPAVREAQWREAATLLTDVLHLDPSDRIATSRLRYCEGHLQRIDGEARKRKKQNAAPQLHAAVDKFTEAARLDQRWPDPYLGLARTYIYGLDDLDRAIAALKDAENRGYKPGNRELVQMADGYRSRAERMRRDAAGVKGLDQEREYLENALKDYRQALELYRQAMGFGDVSANMRQVQTRIDETEARLDEISPDGLREFLRRIIGR